MVLQKRLDYGSSGHQIPPVMPRVPRSAKGKRSVRKKVEEKSMCAFDLLATVAGELLSERESSPALCKINPTATNDSIKQEQFYEKKPYKAEVFDQGSGNESTVDSGFVFQRQGSHCLKDSPNTLNATAILPAVSDKGAFAGGSQSGGAKDEFGYSHDTNSKKCSSEGCYHGSVESCNCKLDIGIKTPLQTDRKLTGNVASGNGSEMYSMEDPMDLDSKPPALVSSDSSVEVPIARNCSFVKSQNNLDLPVDRDDDENSYGCFPSTKTNKAFRPQRIGDRRIRKLLASKFWKVAPTLMKDEDLSNTDAEMKPAFRSRKMCYTRQRTQRGSFKRRKMFERCSIAVSDRGFCGGVVSSPLTKGGIKIEASDSHEIANGANGASSSSTSPKSSYESGDFHVKLSIKSFKVPELFIEIPETASVGSLKRTVMEAVTAILGGGLRVGVLLQGKKVRDDNKTLLQAGISNIDKMDNLGFTLEPNPTQTPPTLASPEDPELLPCDAIEPLNRIPAANPALDQAVSDATLQPPQTLSLNFPDSDHDSVHSPADASSVDKSANSKALVPVPTVSTDALAMVPLRKSRRSELVQRRIRRPFSVSEVEALVQAVEKLGTGRWRDVKLRAFDNAKHRTYVDLKDKWKTLVHTARISPQQRRGEPVPQELLDRVLAAHAYWSQQQAKLQVKPSQAETCLLI